LPRAFCHNRDRYPEERDNVPLIGEPLAPPPARLNADTLPALQALLAAAGVDGWLVYDFKGRNPIASALLGQAIVGTRRLYVYVPATGVPIALVHAIDWELWEGGAVTWPRGWKRRRWVRREELPDRLREFIGGKKVAVDFSPRGAIPYLDTVPAGVVEFLREMAAGVIPSVDFVTRFVSAWTPSERAAHERAAEIVADIARQAIAHAGAAIRDAKRLTEYDLAQWIRERFDRAGVLTDHGPSVCIGANAARNHYDPRPENAASLVSGHLLLIDLWATEPGGIYADQTWMASLGPPSTRDARLWDIEREARDAALTVLRTQIPAGNPVRGGDVDRAARGVIERAGYGDRIECRTGHSIDAFGIHGFGPPIDDTETYDDRLLVPGVGFSIEPGIYLPGEVGVRTEVNAWVGDRELLITPKEIQRELIVV
jgi:Xaa-Pro dipeptidase